MAELTYANSLLAEHEAEVKTLRFQVEELKQKLNQKEDEVLCEWMHAEQPQSSI